MYGKVTKYFSDKGYGFIRGEDGNTYFIHKSNLYGEHIECGYYVHFKVFINDRSDYNAKLVIVIEATERKVSNGKKHTSDITNSSRNSSIYLTLCLKTTII